MSGVAEHVLADWSADPGLLAALAIVTAAYLEGVRRARRWPAARTAAFLGGIAVLVVALQSGLHDVGDRLLAVHMVQHLVLILVAPPLLLAGAPFVLALRSLPPGGRRALARLLMGPVGRTLTRPSVVLAGVLVVLFGTHLPGFYDAALRHPAIHDLEHALYVGASLLLWIPVLAVEPLPHAPSPIVRILIVLAAMAPMVLIGVQLATAEHVVYAPYAGAYGISALADQRAAGTIMWVFGSAIGAVLAVTMGWRGVRQEEARAVAREQAARERVA